MKTSLFLGSAALIALASGASAQGFSGNLGLNYAQPSESGSQSATEYSGGLEYSINRNFGIALDLSGYSIEDVDATILSSTWHFIYHLDEATSFALFAGADVVEDDTVAGPLAVGTSFAGLEAGTEFGKAEGEAYIGFSTTDGAEEDFSMYGLYGEYDFAHGFSAIGSADFINGDTTDLSNIAIGVEYEISGGPELYGKVGQQSIDDEDGDADSTYFEIGASVSFGNNRGTTFNGRSLFEQF